MPFLKKITLAVGKKSFTTYTMTYEYIGYHGTDSDCVASIFKDNFRISRNDNEWLGHGVYFFVEGISDPVENATEWAKNQAYDKGAYKYSNFSVLKAKAKCTRLLDATTIDGLRAFNAVRERIIERHNEFFQPKRDLYTDNQVMWNLVARMMGLEVIIHNLYIKNKRQRISRIVSNVPNATVMCVKAPASIDKNSIEVEIDGMVK